MASVLCYQGDIKNMFIHQMTPERQRCPDVAFIDGSKEY